jgi:CheY-like chemotaxis protein
MTVPNNSPGSFGPILLVEDNPDDVFIVRRALENARIINPLVVLSDGLQAVAYLGELLKPTGSPQVPVVVLLDIKMPHMDGFEVLEWIRSQSRLNRLPVLMLSCSSHTTDVARAYGLHANSYLVKKSSITEMVDLLRSMHEYWLTWNETHEDRVELAPLRHSEHP